ncbi:MAG: hypothetical protein GNW80_01730 [Asgard group archaeon]|nr:hypothetical protein [Asgard group archaeon]
MADRYKEKADELIKLYNEEIKFYEFWSDETLPIEFYDIDKGKLIKVPMDFQIKRLKRTLKTLKSKKKISDKVKTQLESSLENMEKALSIVNNIDSVFKRLSKLDVIFRGLPDKNKSKLGIKTIAKFRSTLIDNIRLPELDLKELKETITKFESKYSKLKIRERKIEKGVGALAISEEEMNQLDSLLAEIDEHFEGIDYVSIMETRLFKLKEKEELVIDVHDIPDNVCRSLLDEPGNEDLRYNKEAGLILLKESEYNTYMF